jgi:hypothetical protein
MTISKELYYKKIAQQVAFITRQVDILGNYDQSYKPGLYKKDKLRQGLMQKEDQQLKFTLLDLAIKARKQNFAPLTKWCVKKIEEGLSEKKGEENIVDLAPDFVERCMSKESAKLYQLVKNVELKLEQDKQLVKYIKLNQISSDFNAFLQKTYNLSSPQLATLNLRLKEPKELKLSKEYLHQQIFLIKTDTIKEDLKALKLGDVSKKIDDLSKQIISLPVKDHIIKEWSQLTSKIPSDFVLYKPLTWLNLFKNKEKKQAIEDLKDSIANISCKYKISQDKIDNCSRYYSSIPIDQHTQEYILQDDYCGQTRFVVVAGANEYIVENSDASR